MRHITTVGAILVATTVSLAAETERMTVKVIDVQNSESEYHGTIPGRVNPYVGTSTINTTVTPSQDVLCKHQKTREVKSRETCKAGEVQVDVREADERMVAACTYLGDVQASSAWGGLVAREKGANNARKSVLQKAAEKGATHLVWSTLTGGADGASASAKRTNCDENPRTEK